MSENKKTAEEQQKKNNLPGKPFKKDDPRINRNGRPKGTKNFKTLFEEAIKKIADKTEKEPRDIEREIVMQGIAKARQGDFKFYKDLHDRLYGKAMQRTDITTKGDKVQLTEEQQMKAAKELIEKYDAESKQSKENTKTSTGTGSKE